MLERLWQYIKTLFGIQKTETSTKQQRDNQDYNSSYINIEKPNITAIFARKLATLTLSDSSITVEGDNQRAELLQTALSEVEGKIRKVIASALGVGGCVLVPYVTKGTIRFNIVKQNRLLIHQKDGEKIISATLLADSMTVNHRVYYRFVNYKVENNTLYLTNRCCTAYGTPIQTEAWSHIPDMAIHGVDRALFGFIKSPVDNRKNADDYGVPITYGCDSKIEEIHECWEQLRSEFKRKKVRLQVDDRTLNKDPKTGKSVLSEDDVYIAGHSEDGDLFHIFDPAIRESSYHARLEELCRFVEKMVGTSRGILTTPESRGATATEIKSANGDTFAVVSGIRAEVEKGIRDYIYACDVLANYYQLSPMGEYILSFDWSYALIESTTETWNQMKDLQSMGGAKKAELRAWVTGESLEAAQTAVDEISKAEPNMQSLLGMSE